jgi:effector-binding domain-containing protein
MKKVFFALLSLLVLTLIVSYFIPSIRENKVFVGNTFNNIISSVDQPGNWIKWDPAVRQAWEKDSSACKFREDSVRHIITIDIPGKRIRVYQINYLLYQLEEIKDNDSSSFVFSIIPYVGNNQPRSLHNSQIAYAQDSRLLFKILPFLKAESFAERTMSDLKSYLENTARFYGLPIQLAKLSDTIFLARQKTITKQELFKDLPPLFEELDSFAQAYHVRPIGSKNVSYSYLPHDSVVIKAGIHINQSIMGDYLIHCMQMPGNQVLAVATYEGPFADRLKAYPAMEKYIFDHQLVTAGVCYEKYLSSLPVSDSSIVKIELTYPLRSSVAQ